MTDEEKSGQPKEKQPDQEKSPEKEKQPQPDNKKKEPQKPPLYKKRGFLPAVIIIAVVLIIAGIIFWLILRQYVSTDDAYIDGHITQISARISSQVTAMHIVDNDNPKRRINVCLQVSGGASQEKVKQFGGQTPLGRPGQPVELASIYVQLAANDASYATGQVYGAAGGTGQP
jgi:hypothetical protein